MDSETCRVRFTTTDCGRQSVTEVYDVFIEEIYKNSFSLHTQSVDRRN